MPRPVERAGWVCIAFVSAFLELTVQARTPNENLVVQGIPEIPAELIERTNQYQNMRSASFQDWLPEGGMLIGTRFAETIQVHRVPFAGARRSQLTFFPERVGVTRACPRKNCPYFLFEMDVGGSEFFQIFRYDLKTGRHTLLTDGKSRNGLGPWNHRGDRVAFASTRRNGKDSDIYLMDPEVPASAKLLLEVEGMWTALDFSPDDKTLLLSHFVSVNESHLFLLDIATGKREALTPEGEKGVAYPAARFSSDGRRIYLTSDLGSDFVRLGYVECGRKGFRPTFLTSSIPWDVEDFDLSSDGKMIAYATNEDGFSQLHLVSPEGRAIGKRLQNPQGVLGGLTFQKRGRLLAFTLSGPRSSGDVYTFDPRTRAFERWTFSETGGLDPATFSTPKLIHFDTFDQVGGKPRRIPALLYLPPREPPGTTASARSFVPPYPVQISLHGGPEGQARPFFLGSQNFKLNELGIALIYPNVRGSSGYGKRYLQLDNGKLREDSVRDVGALLDWVKTRPELDASRVAVDGGSYGGYMSLAALTNFSDRLKCGTSYVGISNFVTFLENTQPYRQDLRRAEYGDERDPPMRAFLESIAPLNNAERIKVPLLVIQGANDPRVPASESDQIVDKVRKGGGTVWYLLAKDEGHGFAKKSNVDYATRSTILFLQKFL